MPPPDGPVLVTEGEAELRDAPSAKEALPEDSRGPLIIIRSPEDGKEHHGPVDVEVLFERSPNGAEPRVETLRVVYVKLWEIDITERFRPYLQPYGLQIKAAKLPPGRHLFRISIADADGKVSTSMVRVIVR